MKEYQYIHIMWPNETKFLKPLVEMLNNEELGFSLDQHLFITPHKDVYLVLSQYPNVILDESNSHLINKYASKCEWLISHDLPNIMYTIRTQRRFLKKIVWRTWGGGHQRYDYKNDSFVWGIIHRLADWCYKKYYNLYFGKGVVGVANSVDIIDLQKWLSNTPLLPIPYIASSHYDTLCDISKETVKNERFNIMVGHQGTRAESHIEIIKKLSKFDQFQLDIYVPLSYGTQSYIDEIIPIIKRMQLPNLHIITDFMEYSEYARFLHQMDLAILDEPSSMALGNISILLFFGNRIMLNRNGILREVFDLNNIPYYCTDQLDTISLADLFKSLNYDGTQNDLVLHEYSYYVDQWREVLSFLEKK